MISLSSWNVRGLNPPLKQDEVRNLINTYKLSLIGLIETKVNFGRRIYLAKNLLPEWEVFYNYSSRSNGRIWAAWDPSALSVQLMFCSDQLMHLLVQSISTQQQFYVLFIYGLNSDLERRPWADICSISSATQSLPWILAGDFNVVRSVSEKAGGDLSWTSGMDELNTCCWNAGIEDLKFNGHLLTWSNKNPSNPIS